jgi:hypothetical protein
MQSYFRQRTCSKIVSSEKKIRFCLPSENLVQSLPESGSVSGSAYNQCGSETLAISFLCFVTMGGEEVQTVQ